MCVDDARVCVILSAGSAMDDYWRYDLIVQYLFGFKFWIDI